MASDHGETPINESITNADSINGIASKTEVGATGLERADSGVWTGVNLRDVGKLSPKLKQGVLFRSSQVVSAGDLRAVGIKSIIDLRQRRPMCGKAENDFLRAIQQQSDRISAVPARLVPEFVKPAYLRSQPVVCGECSTAAENTYGVEAVVFHVDLVNRNVQWSIFYAMPRFVKYKVLQAVFTCTPPEQIMAPAVADDSLYGYVKLYQTLLDSSKSAWAKALRVLTHDKQLPSMVHCIHGKDRTGLFVMLVALLCGVEEEAVIEDYVLSERMLKEGREDGSLGLPEYLSADQVIGAKRAVMERTIQYLMQNYGSAEGYCKNIGLSDREIAKIRMALLVNPDDMTLEEALALRRGSGVIRSVTLDPRRLFNQQHATGGPTRLETIHSRTELTIDSALASDNKQQAKRGDQGQDSTT